jgi:hypothetical protein
MTPAVTAIALTRLASVERSTGRNCFRPIAVVEKEVAGDSGDSQPNEDKISARWRVVLYFIIHNSSFCLAAARPAVRCIAWLDDWQIWARRLPSDRLEIKALEPWKVKADNHAGVELGALAFGIVQWSNAVLPCEAVAKPIVELRAAIQ